MEVICLNCEKKFIRSPSQIRGKIFCSRECRKQHSRPTITCIGCNNKFHRSPKSPKNKYCSWECFKSSRWESVTCEECGIEFQKRVSEIRKAVENGHKHMCSRDCRNKATSKLLGGTGDWVVGGKYAVGVNRGKDWRHAKAAALRRDNFTCQQCESVNDLEVHHWEPYSVSFDNSLENLVTLCRSCHQEKHVEYRREGFYEDLHR